jgi:predicted unusual protein kinase regulating ubiquinone biosynthesis (AarF/ABC1/UbiB family)
MDMRPVMAAWMELIPLECSFQNELKNVVRVRALLAAAPAGLKTLSTVPRPVPEYSSERMFVMEFVEGCKSNDLMALESNNVDKARLVEEITRAYGYLLSCGLIVADLQYVVDTARGLLYHTQ